MRAAAPHTERMRYDAVAKDILENDRPHVLSRMTGGKAIVESLNVEFAIIERRSDLLYLLEDGTLKLVDIQGANDWRMPYRVGVYTLMGGEKYQRPVFAAVLYLGEAPMRMKNYLKCGKTTVEYDLIDIRDFSFETLMAGGPGDWAFAVLTRGGPERLGEILERAKTLQAPARQRLVTQVGVMSGLRRAQEKFKMELTKMPVYIDIEKNVFLNSIQNIGIGKGREEGLAEGRMSLLARLLERKFGKVPEWALLSMKGATVEQIEEWADRVLFAATLEEALGLK